MHWKMGMVLMLVIISGCQASLTSSEVSTSTSFSAEITSSESASSDISSSSLLSSEVLSSSVEDYWAKTTHFSVDDVIAVFRDLTLSTDQYPSLFDHPFFAFYKRLHDTYGMVVSLYCFYEKDDFNLSMMTDKYKDEFTANTPWLRLAFHAKNVDTYYANATKQRAMDDYAMATTEIIRFTGTIEAIDRVPRLHAYSANAISILGLTQSTPSVIGLLSADDDRFSYYLPWSKQDILHEKGTYVDENLHITFFASDGHLEALFDLNERYSIIEAQSTYRPLVMFTHEWAMSQEAVVTHIEAWASLIYEEGYEFIFPMDGLLDLASE